MAGCEDDYSGQTNAALAPLPGKGDDFSSGRVGRQQSSVRQRRLDCTFSEFTMSKRDYDSADREEASDEKAVERRRRGEGRQGLRVVPTAQEPPRPTPADMELRELLEGFKRPAKNEDASTDELPPAA